MKKKHFLVAIGITISLLLATVMPSEAKWPNKPILITIPWPPSNDSSTIVANVLAPVMSKDLGVPVKIINKAGGRGTIGTNFVARSKPDGYTVALSSIGPMMTQPIRGVTPYKTDDFDVLGLVWAAPFTLAASGDAPYNDLKELAKYAEDHQLKLGHWGLGAVPTLIAMGVAAQGRFQWQETAFDDVNALLVTSGDMDVITATMPALVDYYKTNKVKILAVMNPTHYDLCPDVKTVSEQGFGDDYFVWFGLFTPKGIPPEVRKRIEESWFKAMESAPVKKTLANTGVIPLKIGSQEATVQIANEKAHFSKLMKNLGLVKK
jgi:tripartite-type tricarboxylate transporter receptor subunit TctC